MHHRQGLLHNAELEASGFIGKLRGSEIYFSKFLFQGEEEDIHAIIRIFLERGIRHMRSTE